MTQAWTPSAMFNRLLNRKRMKLIEIKHGDGNIRSRRAITLMIQQAIVEAGYETELVDDATVSFNVEPKGFSTADEAYQSIANELSKLDGYVELDQRMKTDWFIGTISKYRVELYIPDDLQGCKCKLWW